MKHSQVLSICVVSVILLWSSFASLQAQEMVILTDKQGEYPLGLHLEILEDTEGRWTIDDVMSPEIARQFVPSRSEVPNFGYTKSTYWVRFRVRNNVSEHTKWRLTLNKADMEYITFYMPLFNQQSFVMKQAGDFLPFTAREVPHRQFIFKLPLSGQTEQTMYLRFKTRAAMILPLTLWSLEAFAQNDQIEQFILGLYYGILLIMTGYNFFLFLSLRDKSYLYYVLFIASFLLNRAVDHGLASQYLWPGQSGWAGFAVVFFAILLILSGQKFTISFLMTRIYTPMLHKIIFFLMVGTGLLLILLPFDRSLTDVLMNVFGLLTISMGLIIGFITWRQGYRPARYYLLAWLTFLSGASLFLLSNLGLLPRNALTQQSMLLGTILLVLFLSLALADRINTIKQEKAEAQAEVLQKQQEKLKQTAELARTNEALNAEITERKRMEETLRESEEKYRRVIENANEIIVVVQGGRFKLVNPATIKITGYPREELLSKPFIEFIHPEDRDVVLDRYRKRQQGEQLPDTYPLRIVHKAGAIRWLEVRAVVIEWEGKPATLTFLNDITERKHAEEELTKYKSHLEELVEQRTAELLQTNKQLTQEINERRRMALFAEMNPAPILRTDLDGTISLANQVANKLFKVHHLIGNSWFVLCPAVGRKDFDQLSQQGRTLQHEYRIGEKDFLFTYLSNVDYGLVHIYGTDITDLKQLEAQLFQSQKMEAIGQLAGGIAHDFNTLLGIILGSGDMMRDDIPEGSLIRNNLEGIINAGDRAKALVKQLLDFAGPSEAGRLPIRLVPLVEDSLRLLRSSLPTTITIRQQIEAISSTVLANSTQIAQVIMNLGMNAGDAIGEREGEIEMTLAEIDVDGEFASFQAVSPGTYVRLNVNDTGCGMSPETLVHIFEPFFTTKEVGKGSGLGLSVVHGIVKSHGGFITVESAPGKGSSFQVYFPSNF